MTVKEVQDAFFYFLFVPVFDDWFLLWDEGSMINKYIAKMFAVIFSLDYDTQTHTCDILQLKMGT